MQWTVRLETRTDGGEAETTELVTFSWPVVAGTLADLGLVLSEAKMVLTKLQGIMVQSQVTRYVAYHRVQGYRIWILPNWARRRVRKVSSHAARMRFAFMDPLEPSSLARLRARRRSRAMFCGP